ncbi:MAG TPA: plasmid pRiA4b ORF-3 family protein [Pirellulales bacterium]|nr:plasmid pRiA4b ORF-3 family protein [Pirellulales bacterium]
MAGKKQTAPEGLYQLKVTLLHVDPPIWRRIQVQDCTLETLHDVIQIAMGWENCHMHQFIVGKTYYGPSPDDFAFGAEMVDEATVLISQLAPANKRKVRFKYEYDFGDSWLHEILVEKCPPPEPGARFPRCVEGERAGPPEDIGGAWGYAELLEDLGKPPRRREHPYFEGGAKFDPEKFSLDEVNKRLGRLR